jgi:molybdopterin-guanine dinucleotide biosynthesis protein A
MLFRRSQHPSLASPSRLTVCVLAGGESRRFGQSKLNVTIDGTPLLAWQARRLAALQPHVQLWLSVSPAHDPLPPGANAYSRIVVDLDRFAGPLMGMTTVLAAAHPTDVVLFVPADMPLLTEAHLRPLLRLLLQQESRVGAMAATPDGTAHRLQPLPSVWRAGSALALMRSAIAAGVRGPSRLSKRRGVHVLHVADRHRATAWRSINRPEDLPSMAAALQRDVAVR